MRVPLSWLRDFVDIDVPAGEIASRLSLSGLETTVTRFGTRIEGIKTVKVLSFTRHPSRERLNICTVTDGAGQFQVVTAASNINPGDIVVLAPAGTELPGRQISEAEFAGVKSQGMLCSLQDLGVEDGSDGLFVLDQDTPVGADANQVLSLGEDILEVEITPNRGDCLSIKGVAREICAVFGLKKKSRLVENLTFQEVFPVEVQADRCYRYMAVAVKNITIKPSPLHVRLRLIKAGLKPINNIVDITNYLMIQEGQPMHAFDLDKLEGSIVVRYAGDGEKILTLDGVERQLTPQDIVIADRRGPVAVAGVIGGEWTKVTGSTKNVLIEIGVFDPVSVRKTARRLGVSTDSSYRFERGVDITACSEVRDRALSMVSALAGGEVVAGNDIYPVKYQPKKVILTVDKLEKVLGHRIEADEVAGILNSLEIPASPSQDRVEADIPAHRSNDIYRDIDLVEEIARIKGYDSFEPSFPRLSVGAFRPDREYEFFSRTRSFMINSGFTEILSYTFTSEDFYDSIGQQPPSIRVQNYILKTQSVMRDTILPGLFSTLEENLRFGQKNLAVFEISSVFFENHEEIRLGILATGKLIDGYSYSDSRKQFSTTREWDFLMFKGVVESYLDYIGVRYMLKPSSKPYMHPYQSADLIVSDRLAGYVGKLHPQVARSFDYPDDVYVAELMLKYVPRSLDENYMKDGYLLTWYIQRDLPVFREAPKFPPVKRDLAFVVDADIPAGEFERDLLSSHPLVWKVKLFDVYHISAEKKSLAYSVEFLSREKSLSDEEVNLAVDEILARLKLKYIDLSLRS